MNRSICALGPCIFLYATAAAAQEPAPPLPQQPLNFSSAMPGPNVLVTVLRRGEVQAHLRLTVKEKSDLADVLDGKQPFKLQVSREGDTEDPEAIKRQIEEQVAKQVGGVEERLKQTLTADQMARLRELALQWRGMISLGDPNTAERLKLTADHRQEVARIVGDYERQKQQVIMATAQTEQHDDGGNRAVMVRLDSRSFLTPGTETFKKLTALKGDAESKIAAVLSDEEKSTWKAAQGGPFTFRTDTPANRF